MGKQINKLWILNQNEELQAVLQNKGAAFAFFNANHKEELNGANTLEFEVPANVDESKYLVEENIVLYRDSDLNWNEFRIKETDSSHDGGFIKKVICEHGSTELIDFPVADIRPTNRPVTYILTQILQNTRWNVGNVTVGGEYSHVFYHTNALAAIHDLVKLCGGELQFRTKFEGNKIVGRFVDILVQRGAYRGKRFEYGKDIVNLKLSTNSSPLVTAVIGLGKGVESESGTGYGRRLNFKDVEWSVVDGDPIDKPLGQDWIGDPQSLQMYGYPSPNGKIHRKRYIIFEDIEDPDELLKLSWDYLQQYKMPPSTLDLTVVDLETAEGYEHEFVRLGDIVNVIDTRFNPKIRVQMRVVSLERDLNNPENTKITLGYLINTFKNSEKQHELERDRDKTTNTGWLDGTIDTIKNNIKIGNATKIDDVILVLDKPEDQNPTKAIMIGNGMIAIANSKIGPEWNWRTFMTGDTVVADLIQAGTMLADRIRGGDLYLGGIVNGIGKDGRLFFLDSEDEITMQFDAKSKSVDQLFVGKISGNNVVTKTFEDFTFYVDPINGSDENDGLTIDTPFQTLEKAVNTLPDVLQSVCTIKLSEDSVLNEEIRISGLSGSGQLIIDFQNSTLNGYIRVDAITHRVVLTNGKIVHTGAIAPQDIYPKGCVIGSVSNSVTCRNMILDANSKADSSFFIESGFGIIANCELYNSIEGLIYATYGSQVTAFNNKGNGGKYGMLATNGARISGYGTKPQGTVQNEGTSGGGVVQGSWDSNPSPGTTPPTPTLPGKLTLTSNNAKSWDTKLGWNGSYPRQGNPSRWDSRVGTCKGLWFFDYQKIQQILNGKTPKSIRINIQRRTKGGNNQPIPIYFWTHNLASPSGNDPSLSNSAGILAKFKWGQGDWVNLPLSFANALKSGTAKGISIYVNSTSSDLYAVFEPRATLEITY